MPANQNPNEVLYSPLIAGIPYVEAQSKANQFAGRTTLSSGSATVVVSTTSVKSDSIIVFGLSAPATDVASGAGKAVEVKSITDSSAFVLGTSDGIAMARDTTVAWMIFRT